jgi:hypothetical protein
MVCPPIFIFTLHVKADETRQSAIANSQGKDEKYDFQQLIKIEDTGNFTWTKRRVE